MDPRAFIGTGVLRGNRGILVVDELPAIPTKVQVLFHPMLQEDKIVLEEYAWERPIDLFFIATGNPSGFAHVNRIPEPLLDRLELIPMGLPEEAVEREIMHRERFRVREDFFAEKGEEAKAEPLRVLPPGGTLVDRGRRRQDFEVHAGVPQHRQGCQHKREHQGARPRLLLDRDEERERH